MFCEISMDSKRSQKVPINF